MYKNKKISLYTNVMQTENKIISLERLIDGIKNPKKDFAEAINELRKAHNTNDLDRKDKIKKMLPAVTLSATFGDKRTLDNVLSVTGLLQIDFDHCEPYWKNTLALHSCIVASFISPSGDGVKGIAAVDYSEISQHKDAVYTLNKFILENGLPENDKVIDLPRLMFASMDKDIYINYDAIPLKLEKEVIKTQKPIYIPNDTNDDIQDILKHISPDCDYDTWLKIGMGLKGCGEPLQTWESWSEYGSKNKKGDCVKRWKGLTGSVGKGTLIYFAKKNGYIPKNDILNFTKMSASDFKEQEIPTGKIQKGLPCGFFTLDRNLLGFRDGWVTIVTGVAGQGKTTFTRQIFLNYGKNKNKAFMFFGEGETKKEENLLAMGDGADLESDIMFGRTIYSASDKGTKSFMDSMSDYLTMMDMVDVMGVPVFECLFEEMKIKAKQGVKLFILDNLMKLTVACQSNDVNAMQKQIIFNLKNFAMFTGTHVILIAHPNKGGEEVSGATEVKNTVDVILRFQRIEKPMDNPLIASLDMKQKDKESISASVVVQKGRDRSLYEPAYFKWSEKHNTMRNITTYMNPDEYKNNFHWTEFVSRMSDSDVPRDNPALNANIG